MVFNEGLPASRVLLDAVQALACIWSEACHDRIALRLEAGMVLAIGDVLFIYVLLRGPNHRWVGNLWNLVLHILPKPQIEEPVEPT